MLRKDSLKALILLVLGLGIGACQSSGSNGFDVTTSSTSYMYKLEDGACKTGEHSFNSKSDYCNGLQDETLNDGCASAMRQDSFNLNCTGSNAAKDAVLVPNDLPGNSGLESNVAADDNTSTVLPSPTNCTLKVIGADGVTTIQADSADSLVGNFQQAKNAVSFCRSL